MATSSILTELVIEDPKKAEAFINALEMSSQDPVCSPSAPSIPILDIIMQYMLMRTLKFIRGQQKKSIIISSGNYPNILFPGTLPKSSRILQDCIWPFLQPYCYHFYLFRIHEKIPMNYYIQSLLRQSNIYAGK